MKKIVEQISSHIWAYRQRKRCRKIGREIGAAVEKIRTRLDELGVKLG